MATALGPRVDDLAHELFSVVTQICLSTLRGRRRPGELKEVEFLTLALLQANSTMIVGDIQRVLGVLPAQMSRVIRSLENRERPLISCGINPEAGVSRSGAFFLFLREATFKSGSSTSCPEADSCRARYSRKVSAGAATATPYRRAIGSINK